MFCDFFMHERHVIFVNMMTFDKTNGEHRRAVKAIFQTLFEEGRKRGYSKYRSHVNAMGEFVGSDDARGLADMTLQIKWLRCMTSTTTLTAGSSRLSRTRWIRMVSCRRENKEFGQRGFGSTRSSRPICRGSVIVTFIDGVRLQTAPPQKYLSPAASGEKRGQLSSEV